MLLKYTQTENIKKPCSQVPTSILYKDGKIDHEDSMIWGLEISEPTVSEGDVYIKHIKEYICGTDGVLEELEQAGLTIEKVVTDYLKKLHGAAIEKISAQEIVSHTPFKVEDCRYCIACPLPHRDLMTCCFIEAGIITEEEAEDRLMFVTESEAAAYNCLGWDRKLSKTVGGKHYLVCDIGHTTFGISKINVSVTESLSTVSLLSEHAGQGSMCLENSLRNYLVENAQDLKINRPTIEAAVLEFIESVKFHFSLPNEDTHRDDIESLEIKDHATTSPFKTTDVGGINPIQISLLQLSQEVFLPFINHVINSILEVDQEECERIFLTGKFGSDYNFIDALTSASGGLFQKRHTVIDHMSLDAVSRGAVAFALRTNVSQIPFSHEDSVVTESGKKPEAVKKCDFIVGIDFGTTHSGCSYAGFGEKNMSIRPLTSWPKQDLKKYAKAPTLLVYNTKSQKTTSKWGQKAKEHQLRYSERLLENFKLFLSPESVKKYYGEVNENIIRIRESFTTEDVEAIDLIAEYLKLFKTYIDAQIRDREAGKWLGIFPERLVFSYVITVPAMWDREAKDTMVLAAIKAGLIEKGQHDKLLIITEPEAAALACETYYQDYKKDGAFNFVVCDAGGGTVDLVTFCLKNNEEGSEVIYQIGNGEGDTCGSVYLERRFRKYMKAFYADIGYDLGDDVDFSKTASSFMKIKHDFNPSDTTDRYYSVILPAPTYNARPTSGRTRIQGNVLKIHCKELEEKVFRPVVCKIEALIDRQIEKMKGEDVHVILLVGGFSQCKYLQKTLINKYKLLDIKVVVPKNAVTAISEGAVSYAQRPRMISNKVVGLSYALEVHAPFIKEQGQSLSERETFIANDGEEYFKSRLEYFVKKNEEADEGKTLVYEKQVFIEYPKNAVIAIFSCDYSEINEPEWKRVNKSHTKVLEVRFNMPYLPEVEENEIIPFKVALQLNQIGGINVIIECLANGNSGPVLDTEISSQETFQYVRKSDPVYVKTKLRSALYILPNLS
ncbi:hypothetical protein EDC94DRAFT_242599 [Helicostylum pulchrum]|nr:hypothetical protein EDC94DRAFT_242599 [Helicostylum pulchrum]